MIDWKENWGEAPKIQEASIMHGWTKRSLVFVIVAVLVCTSTGFSALAQDKRLEEEATAEGMIIDFALLRPLGIAASGVGVGFFIASLPFSLPTGSIGVAFRKLVAEPVCFTFARPLGKVY
jgi:hypothetical protein